MFNLKKIARLEAEVSFYKADFERERELNTYLLDVLEKQGEILTRLESKVEPKTLKVFNQSAIDLAYKLRKDHPIVKSSAAGGHLEYYKIPVNAINSVILDAEETVETKKED